ncbi:mitochondrial intermembrane space import and assembly protein 40-A [Hyalella azteca]|uniref:Mitochondrial intermembrane space import and assembly protein 40-A n=1 Tax=Hyalella azteca TaxID=294128 RepID=A0A8B7PHC9_HYAAZ|nr:mitochondrial intermembrane space import and assembly protein 40-A [Hyalella azteca]
MSFCKQEGKDKIIFLAEEDDTKPTIKLPDDEEPAGLIKEDGSLNWSCPCLGGMATGPCGVEFRDAFTCFHYSEADPKGSDCVETFRTMSQCMAEFPGVYGSGEDNVMNVTEDEEEESEGRSSLSSDRTVSKVEDKPSEQESNNTSQSSSSQASKS